MIITNIPYYCGGRFISGFYNPQNYPPGHVYKMSTHNWNAPAISTNRIDPCIYLPNDFVEFLQILRRFLYTSHGLDGFQGVVYAVTNPQQTTAPKYLKDAGFEAVGSFKKGVRQNACTSWIGDYRGKIYPILSKVPDFIEKIPDAKFKPIETVQIAMPAQVQNTIRDIAQQTLSTANGRESTIRFSR